MNKVSTVKLPEKFSDKEIIDRIIAGEQKLFGLLVRKYNARLFRMGMAIMNSDTEVEDIMQTTYTKAYENLFKFENRSSFGTWLTRIMINESLLQLKRKKLYMSTEGDIQFAINNILHSYSGSENPAQVVMNKELAKAIETALADLPEKYRLVFVMREVENMSVAETMEVLDISETNVKVRLNRAKAMLKQKLQNYYKSDNIYHFHLTRCDAMVRNVLLQLEIEEGKF
jgi:RNA polymerase sigma-70 factor (ECF subfamily)